MKTQVQIEQNCGCYIESNYYIIIIFFDTLLFSLILTIFAENKYQHNHVPIRNFIFEYKIINKADLRSKKKRNSYALLPTNCNQCIFHARFWSRTVRVSQPAGRNAKWSLNGVTGEKYCLTILKVAPKLTLSSSGMIPLEGRDTSIQGSLSFRGEPPPIVCPLFPLTTDIFISDNSISLRSHGHFKDNRRTFQRRGTRFWTASSLTHAERPGTLAKQFPQ